MTGPHLHFEAEKKDSFLSDVGKTLLVGGGFGVVAILLVLGILLMRGVI